MFVRRPAAPRLGRLPFLLVTAALLVTACVPGGTGTTAAPTPTLGPTASPSANPYTGASAGSGTGMKLGYISYGEQVDFVRDISAGIRSQVSTAGAELVECDAALDASRIAPCIKQMTDAGVKGLILFEAGLESPSAVCAALPDGLPVVAIEESKPEPGSTGSSAAPASAAPSASPETTPTPSEPPCQKLKVNVSADDLRAGQIAGAAVGAWVKATWGCTYDAYLALQSTVAFDRSRLRIDGFRQGFAGQCAVTNEQFGPRADTIDTGNAATTDLLGSLAGKKRILIVAMNDDGALGAIQAATAAGRTTDVFVSGQGGDSRAREQIRTNGQWIGDSAYFPERFGASAVPALLDLIAGKAVPAELLVQPAWIDKSNIGSVYPS